MSVPREIAEAVFKWSNICLVISLIVGAGSTALVVWMGKERDLYAAKDLSDAGAQAAEANKAAGVANSAAGEANRKAAVANKEAGKLRERAAVYEKDAAEARKETELLRSQLTWRELSIPESQRMVEILKIQHGEVLITHRDDPESASFAWDLHVTFQHAGWTSIYQEEPVKGLKFGVLTWQNPQLPGRLEFEKAISSLSSLHQLNLDMDLNHYVVDVGFRPRRNMKQ